MFDNVSLRLDALQSLFKGDRTVKLQLTENGFFTNPTVSLTTILQTSEMTVSLACFARKGDKYGFHSHVDSLEYLIVSKGTFLIVVAGTPRVMVKGECCSMPKGMLHSGEALEDDTQVLAVCVPPEPAYVIGS
jgi:quercetin dioxygenase-like cupin family protein